MKVSRRSDSFSSSRYTHRSIKFLIEELQNLDLGEMGVSWADSTRAKYVDRLKTIGGKIQQNSGAAKMTSHFHFLFGHFSRNHYTSKQRRLPLLSTVDKHGWCLLTVYFMAPYPWFPCSVKSPKTWLHHLPESLAFVLFYMSLSPCQHSWQKLCACHFLFSHTKDGRTPNFCGKTADHGGIPLQLRYPLEMKKSENKGVVN